MVIRGNAEASNPYIRPQALDAALRDDGDALELILASNPNAAFQRFHDPVSNDNLSLLVAAAVRGTWRVYASWWTAC